MGHGTVCACCKNGFESKAGCAVFKHEIIEFELKVFFAKAGFDDFKHMKESFVGNCLCCADLLHFVFGFDLSLVKNDFVESGVVKKGCGKNFAKAEKAFNGHIAGFDSDGFDFKFFEKLVELFCHVGHKDNFSIGYFFSACFNIAAVEKKNSFFSGYEKSAGAGNKTGVILSVNARGDECCVDIFGKHLGKSFNSVHYYFLHFFIL